MEMMIIGHTTISERLSAMTVRERQDRHIMSNAGIIEFIIVRHQGVGISVQIPLGTDNIEIAWGHLDRGDCSGRQMLVDIEREFCEAGIEVFISGMTNEWGDTYKRP